MLTCAGKLWSEHNSNYYVKRVTWRALKPSVPVSTIDAHPVSFPSGIPSRCRSTRTTGRSRLLQASCRFGHCRRNEVNRPNAWLVQSKSSRKSEILTRIFRALHVLCVAEQRQPNIIENRRRGSCHNTHKTYQHWPQQLPETKMYRKLK